MKTNSDLVFYQLKGLVSILHDIDFDRVSPDEYRGAVMAVMDKVEECEVAVQEKSNTQQRTESVGEVVGFVSKSVV